MNYIDYIVMAAFFAVLFLIPAISAMRSKSKGANEYFKSAGSMPWWLIGVSMVAATCTKTEVLTPNWYLDPYGTLVIPYGI